MQNCWEVLQCGRQPGGEYVDEFGVCPAAVTEHYDTINQGTNAGRFCWAVAGTFCGGEVQGASADKATGCMHCSFYLQVVSEERGHFIVSPTQLE
jgi:hypothetical protein